MDTDKHRLYHRLHGSRCLDNKVAEAVAYLLSDPRTEGDISIAYPDLTPEAIQVMTADELFQRRVTYLKDRAGRKKKKPTTYDEYERFALRTLHKMAQTSDDSVKVNAAKELGRLAHLFRQDQPEPQSKPTLDMENIKRAYGEK